jgi:hypothetical protein
LFRVLVDRLVLLDRSNDPLNTRNNTNHKTFLCEVSVNLEVKRA